MPQPVTNPHHSPVHPLLRNIVAHLADHLVTTERPSTYKYAEEAKNSCLTISSLLESREYETALTLLEELNLNPNLPERDVFSRQYLSIRRHIEDLKIHQGDNTEKGRVTDEW